MGIAPAKLWSTALLALTVGACPALACETHAFLLCEDFETTAPGEDPDASIWSLQLGDGSSIVVDDARATGGSHAARVTITEGLKWAYMQTDAIFPDAANGFWGRMYFLIGEERPEGEELVHWNLIEAMAERDPITMYRYGGISVPELSRNYFIWNLEKRPRPEGFNELSRDDDFQARVDAGRWHCVEWLFDAETDTSRFFWNGEERAELRVMGEADGVTFDMLPFRALNVGFTIYQPILKPYEVWIDDIAIDVDRVGCAG